MADKDQLNRFIFENAPIRGEMVNLKESYLEIINQHYYPPALKKLIGESLAVAALLSAIIKFKGRLSVQFRGKGKLKLLLTQCDNRFNLRALAKWEGDLSYEDLMQSFNEGVLVIMLDAGTSKGRYQGIVAWRGNSLVESIEGYFRDSEQLATRIWLSVNETSAYGFLIQIAPTREKDFKHVEGEIIHRHWDHIIKLTSVIDSNHQLYEMDPAEVLHMLYPDEDIRLFSPVNVSFRCTCTRKRGEDAILILGQKEAEEELKDKQIITVTCDFCNREYEFDRVDVAKIFQENKPSKNDTQLH